MGVESRAIPSFSFRIILERKIDSAQQKGIDRKKEGKTTGHGWSVHLSSCSFINLTGCEMRERIKNDQFVCQEHSPKIISMFAPWLWLTSKTKKVWKKRGKVKILDDRFVIGIQWLHDYIAVGMHSFMVQIQKLSLDSVLQSEVLLVGTKQFPKV